MKIGIIICDRYKSCFGGEVEYTPEEMVKNGVDVIHLATGMVVGYPPCPHLTYFRDFIPEKYGVPVVVGTHPIPEKYLLTHTNLNTWDTPEWQEMIAPVMSSKLLREAYN